MAREQAQSVGPVLLGLLFPGPKHGYELHQEFTESLGAVWQVGLSQLYAQLKALEDEGLVACQTEVQPNRPARKVYSLTESGRQRFLEWLHEPTPHIRGIRLEFLSRLFLFNRLGLPGLRDLIDRQKALCHDRAETFGRLADEASDPFLRRVYLFRKGQVEAVIHWLDTCVETP